MSSFLNSVYNLFRPNSYTEVTYTSGKSCENSGKKHCHLFFTNETGNSYDIAYSGSDKIDINASVNGKNKKLTLVEDQAKKVHDHITHMGSMPFSPFKPFAPFKPLIMFKSTSGEEKLMNQYKQKLENYERAIVNYKAEKFEYSQKTIEYAKKRDELMVMINHLVKD